MSLPEATKYDQGKPQFQLLPFVGLNEVAKVCTFGATKYDPHNWRKGMSWGRLVGACLRHLCAWVTKSGPDQETGLTHLAHAAWCLLVLIEYEATGTGLDDRVTQTDVMTRTESKTRPTKPLAHIENQPHELGLEPIY